MTHDHAAVPTDEANVDQRRLVERARGGDHDAFAELAREAVVRLDRAARLILRDPELARDAVQEGLIQACRDLPKLRDLDRFDAWLYRLTVNACLDQTRRRRRRVVEVELTPMHCPVSVGALVRFRAEPAPSRRRRIPATPDRLHGPAGR